MTKVREILMNNKNVSYSQLICLHFNNYLQAPPCIYLTSWDSSIMQGSEK